MQYNNTKDKMEFILSHIGCGIIGWTWYRVLAFRCVGKYSLSESRMMLFWLVAFSIIGGIALFYRKQRNSITVYGDVVLGFGIYCVFSYFPIKKTLIVSLGITAAVLSAVYFAYLLFYPIRNVSKRKQIMKRRIVRGFIATKNILCVALLGLILIIGAGVVFDGAISTPSVRTATMANVREQTIKNNMDMLTNLYEDTWEGLSVEEKLNVLQTVANVEQRYLGLPHELNIRAGNVKATIEGYYEDNEHIIMINLDYLLNRSSYEMVECVTHEAYHALQSRMVDAYDATSDDLKNLIFFDTAAAYKNEFDNYSDGEKNFEEYYYQKCEENARRYSMSAAPEYFEKVYEHLGLKYVGEADDNAA